jgi:glycosyltransferase involved in cell wall biosynthesis
MKALTIFTPTYNRKHTLPRTYEALCHQTSDDFDWLIIDDGSTDGTREWVESLGEKITSNGQRFDWMGRESDGEDDNHYVVDTGQIRIEYIYKPNGGLYTGYNVAYATIQTELCVCIDSDDYMPDDAVEKIVRTWNSRPQDKEYCGIVGLDFNVVNGQPIGGYFPCGLGECFENELTFQKIHVGDTKEVIRTDLVKKVAPMIGFEGEKNFNPWYMLMQVVDAYPILVLNENLCWVEYQIGRDSMSQGIWRQYINSPRSFAKHRSMSMRLKHNTFANRLRNCIHYVSSCIIAKDRCWLKNSPMKAWTLVLAPAGLMLAFLVYYKNRK